MILVGLGLQAVFAAEGDAFIEVLNDRVIAYAAIAAGGAVMIWAMLKMFTLLKRKAELMRG